MDSERIPERVSQHPQQDKKQRSSFEKHITWQIELGVLAIKYSHLGIYPDLANASIDEKWGMYRRLLREDRKNLNEDD